jgi:hypothetical protein
MKVYLKSVADEGDCLPGEAVLECIDCLGEKHPGLFGRDFMRQGMLEVSIWNLIMCGDNPAKDIVEIVPQGGQFINRGNILRVYRRQLQFIDE